MRVVDAAKHAVVVLFAVLILVLLLSQLIGQPVLVFVETGSMEPTLEPGDGYVAVPAAVAGEIEEGDVILFEAQELGGGELTTHRVDAVTDEGYITKGDANPFTDQENEEPIVQDEQIQSVALEVNGDLVVIPNLGGATETITSAMDFVQDRLFTAVGLEPPGTAAFATGILLTGFVLLILSTLDGLSGKRGRQRMRGSPLRNGIVVILVLALIVLVPLNLAMVLPSGVYQYEIQSTLTPTDDEQVIQAGESAEVTYQMQNGGQLPMLVVLEPAGEGVEIHEETTYLPRQSAENVSVTMSAPEETGTHYRFVEETRYVVFMPPAVISLLHSIHPVVALGVINAVAVAPIVVIGLLTLGTDRVRLRSRSRNVSTLDRLRRRIGAGNSSESDRRSGFDGLKATFERVRDDTRTRVERVRGPNVDVESDRERASGERSTRGTDLEEIPWDRSFDGPAYQAALAEQLLAEPPTERGLSEEVWTAELLREYLNETYDESFTLTECRTLMIEAGRAIVGTDHVRLEFPNGSTEADRAIDDWEENA